MLLQRGVVTSVQVQEGSSVSVDAALPEGHVALVLVTHVGTEWEHRSVVFWTFEYKASWSKCSSSNTTVTVEEITVSPSPFTMADTVSIKGGFYASHTVTGGYIDVKATALGMPFNFQDQPMCGSSTGLQCPVSGDFFLTTTIDLAKTKLPTNKPLPKATATATGYSNSGAELFCYNLEIKLTF